MLRALTIENNGSVRLIESDQLTIPFGNEERFLWLDISEESKETSRHWLQRAGIHTLAIQDALRDRHPPKFESFPGYRFILLRGLSADSDSIDVDTIQLSLFVGEHFLITCHNKRSVSVDHWWQALLDGSAPGRPETLGYRIAAFAATRYLDILLNFEPNLAEIEEAMFRAPNDQLLSDLVSYRTRLRSLTRVFNYHVRVFSSLRTETPCEISGELCHILNDLFEKYERLHSLSSMYYDLTGDLIDGYISTASHRLNNTMRVLTVITAIFVPLSFLAGLYGMNFEHMPELHHPSGYFILLTIMLIIATGLLMLFKRFRWL